MWFTKGQGFEEKYVVSEQILESFLGCFGDRNPLHTDKSFARNYGFRAEVIHGNILNGFLSHFIGECLPLKNVVIHTQEIKYKNPVYLNDVLNLNAEVKDFFESVNVVEFQYNFSNHEKVVVANGKFQIGILT